MPTEKLLQASAPQNFTGAGGALTAQVPANHVLERILILNTSANAITGARLGLETDESDVMAETDIPATPGRLDYVFRDGLGTLLHHTAATTLYLTAATWNSANVTAIIYTRDITVPS
jgi:hypothetical protein